MYIKLKKVIFFLVMIILITLFLQSTHYLLSLLGVVSFSNILDGMPFYYGTTNYFKYIFDDFFVFFNIVFFWSIFLLLYFIFVKYLFFKFYKVNYLKFFFINLVIYFTINMFYFEFFADISPTGPDYPISPIDLFFRLFLVLFLPMILIFISRYVNKKYFKKV